MSVYNFEFYGELSYISGGMRNPAFCMCKNKAADQLRGNRATYQCLCFRYIDRKISLYFLNPKFQACSHLWLYSPVYVGPSGKP